MSNQYTELQRYRIERVQRVLLNTYCMLHDEVRSLLVNLDESTEDFDALTMALSEFSRKFEKSHEV